MKRAATALVLALFGAALAGCSRATIQPGTAQLSYSRARVQIASAGEPFRAADAGSKLRTGDAVRVVTGDAELRLAHGAVLVLRKGSEVVVGEQPLLRRGDAVAEVEDEPVTVRAQESRVTVLSGAGRITTGLGLTAGAYSGRSRVSSAARSIDVPAYRQVDIAAFGVVPSTPSPLEYDAEDRWDLHYLGTAIEIGEELQRKSSGFSAQLRPTEGRTSGFFSLLLPDLPSASLDACPTALGGLYGQGRPPGEVLVGASLVLQADDGAFAKHCREAFAFRDAGATWGLVALDLGARSLPTIRERLVAALGRVPGDATLVALDAPPSAGPEPEPAASPTSPSSPPPQSEQPRSLPPSPSQPPSPLPPVTTPTPTPPILPVPPLPGVPQPNDGLLEPVTDVVNNLLGGLLG